jgi:FMN reductase
MKKPMTDAMLARAGLGIEPTAPETTPETHRVAALAGDSRTHSRTASLASALAVRIARELTGGVRGDASWRLIDLAGSGVEAWGRRPPDAALATVAGAEIVIVASPVRRGSYSGLTKLFLDALGDRALARSVAIPVMVAKTTRHALAADVHLRPVLLELGASCPTPSLFALESRLSNPGAVCGAWFERARPALSQLGAG